jgi:hypothetical protein
LNAAQYIHGFWDKSSVHFHNLRGINASKLEGRLKAIESSLESGIKSNQEFEKGLKKQKVELDKMVNEKKQQFSEITSAFSAAQSSNQQITNLLNTSTTQAGQIDAIKAKQESNLEKTEGLITSYDKEFKAVRAEVEETIATLEEFFKKIEANLTFTEENQQFIEEKKQEIIKLTGKAADGALGHTFKARQEGLNWSTWIWLGVMIFIVVVGGFWIHFVFTSIPAQTDTQWVNLVINALKASPALILIGFAINQYSKERSLKEEYAFKAAVAMTINAYADEISEAFKNQDTSREKMILETIQKVYLPPRFYPEKSGSLFSNGSKELQETLKSLKEAVQEIKKPSL